MGAPYKKGLRNQQTRDSGVAPRAPPITSVNQIKFRNLRFFPKISENQISPRVVPGMECE
jgi:hypothetical protein